MEKRSSDVSKTVALVLIILTVIISAASTWVLITKSMESEPVGGSLNSALVQLRILKASTPEPVASDTNAGDVKLFIAKAKGG